MQAKLYPCPLSKLHCRQGWLWSCTGEACQFLCVACCFPWGLKCQIATSNQVLQSLDCGPRWEYWGSLQPLCSFPHTEASCSCSSSFPLRKDKLPSQVACFSPSAEPRLVWERCYSSSTLPNPLPLLQGHLLRRCRCEDCIASAAPPPTDGNRGKGCIALPFLLTAGAVCYRQRRPPCTASLLPAGTLYRRQRPLGSVHGQRLCSQHSRCGERKAIAQLLETQFLPCRQRPWRRLWPNSRSWRWPAQAKSASSVGSSCWKLGAGGTGLSASASSGNLWQRSSSARNRSVSAWRQGCMACMADSKAL